MKQNRAKQKPDAPEEVKKQRTKRMLRGRWYDLKDRISLFGMLQKNLLFASFLTLVGLVYIWNSHLAEKQAREVDRLNQQVKELESEYNTLNAQLSKIRKQSTLVDQVDTLGLQVSKTPPIQLTIDE